MTSIGELFPKCRKLAYDARQQVAQAQQGLMAVTDVQVTVDELTRQLDLMEDLVLRETPAQRTVWKRKIAQLRQECQSLRQQSQAAAQRRQYTYNQDRDELLRNRRREKHNESDVQNLSAEARSYDQSNYMVTGLIDQGEASLNSLQEQRQRLRGVNRVVFDMGHRLGLTQATMRIIERRDVTDAYFVAGGMIITLIVFYFVWIYEHQQES